MLQATWLLLLAAACHARDFTFVNNLGTTIWVGLQPNEGSDVIANGGWQLDDGQTVVQNIPDGWGGRFWARTGCSFDDGGNGQCQTGDCGNVLECNGNGGAPPLTLAEIRLNGDQNQDFYDISLVNGFNTGTRIEPTDRESEGERRCEPAGCTANVNANCPENLQERDDEGNVIGCWNSCDITQSDADCCTGANATPDTCDPNESAVYFKSQCPDAYSYAYDDATSTFVCYDTNYRVTFVQN